MLMILTLLEIPLPCSHTNHLSERKRPLALGYESYYHLGSAKWYYSQGFTLIASVRGIMSGWMIRHLYDEPLVKALYFLIQPL
jgi:hypothetical protein